MIELAPGRQLGVGRDELGARRAGLEQGQGFLDRLLSTPVSEPRQHERECGQDAARGDFVAFGAEGS